MSPAEQMAPVMALVGLVRQPAGRWQDLPNVLLPPGQDIAPAQVAALGIDLRQVKHDDALGLVARLSGKGALPGDAADRLGWPNRVYAETGPRTGRRR